MENSKLIKNYSKHRKQQAGFSLVGTMAILGIASLLSMGIFNQYGRTLKFQKTGLIKGEFVDVSRFVKSSLLPKLDCGQTLSSVDCSAENIIVGKDVIGDALIDISPEHRIGDNYRMRLKCGPSPSGNKVGLYLDAKRVNPDGSEAFNPISDIAYDWMGLFNGVPVKICPVGSSPNCTFSAVPNNITEDESTTLTLHCTDCTTTVDSAIIDGTGVTFNGACNATKIVIPGSAGDHTYLASATNAFGTSDYSDVVAVAAATCWFNNPDNYKDKDDLGWGCPVPGWEWMRVHIGIGHSMSLYHKIQVNDFNSFWWQNQKCYSWGHEPADWDVEFEIFNGMCPPNTFCIRGNYDGGSIVPPTTDTCKNNYNCCIEYLPCFCDDNTPEQGYQGFSVLIKNTHLPTCEIDLSTLRWRTMAGCFAPGTRIMMADKTKKAIKQIRQGDLVLNPVDGKTYRVSEVMVGPEKPALFEIGYSSNRVRVTGAHPMVIRTGLKMARNISLGDEILGGDGSFHRVGFFRRLPIKRNQMVWNIELDVDDSKDSAHMIWADGIVTGDLFLQQKLEKRE